MNSRLRMNSFRIGLLWAISLAGVQAEESLPDDEAGVIAYFEKAGDRITLDEEGHAVKLFSGGKPPHSTEALQLIGKLTHLEQLALNAPQAGDEEWEFLHELKNLNQLTIWHCKTFRSLAPFSGLSIEGLTIGGCMGLRDLNRENPEKQRDAVLTLRDLPRLKRLNLYHSPVTPGDAHLAHLAKEFPLLEDLKLDFQAPRGTEASLTPEGLAGLQGLPIAVLTVENVGGFTPEHVEAIAKIDSLEAFLIDVRKKPVETTPLVEAMKRVRPDVEVVVAGPEAEGPPRRSRKP